MSEGARYGRYRVLSELGRGGMGVVYLAEDDNGERFALKVLERSADPSLFERFLREAAVGEELDHPDIVHVRDHGVEAGRAWMTMDLLRGFELEQVMHDASFDLEARLSVVVRVAAALHHVHGHALVHRDVKPSNVFITKDGGVRLLDFGIALMRDQRLTQTGMLMGTPHYMSPEQLSSGTVDARSDVFALGVVLYRMLSNRFPWSGDTAAHVMFSIATRPPEPLTFDHWDFGLDERREKALAQIVDKALASEPSHRFQSALELGAAVEAFLLGRFADAPTGGEQVVDTAQIAARRIDWARARAARLALDKAAGLTEDVGRSTDVGGARAERDLGPVVWLALVVAFAVGLGLAAWYAFSAT